ncbi:MAG: CDGSH iron-sulfur domain-containing protein [Pseudomonadota bacterium]
MITLRAVNVHICGCHVIAPHETMPEMAAKITPIPDGPLVIEEAPPILGDGGKPISTGGRGALCRCGASKMKPWCDGSHKAAGFSSAPTDATLRDQPLRYAATTEETRVSISYTPVLCSHAAECSRLAASVFDPTRDPWIKPDEGSLESIRDVMAACPSGALSLSLDDAPHEHTTRGESEIQIEPNGPYRVTNVTLEAPFSVAGASEKKYVLCRCGQSDNKPFCDGTHHDIAWRDDE